MNNDGRPLLFVIFGVTGDLSHRKILPAMYRLIQSGNLPSAFKIVGVTRQEYSVEQLYADFEQRYEEPCDKGVLQKLHDATTIATLNMTSDDSYISLRQTLERMSVTLGNNVSRIYYLSIPAQAFIDVIQRLGTTGHNVAFNNETSAPRLLVEKPFGYDLPSAKVLLEAAAAYFSEDQLFRIDHYLAKETAQNILTFRFDNPLFQTIWNARHIDAITVNAYETIGIEGRVNFYEQTGALRDIIQSHLLQLLALITMEEPGNLDSDGIRRAKRRLLESITPISREKVTTLALRGQYKGYRDEVQNTSSNTETFARLNLEIDNEQWRGTRIVLESGKALAEKNSQIAVHFRAAHEQPGSNTLLFRLQPQEGITLTLEAKAPGLGSETKVVDMAFDYVESFGNVSGEAYERVIVDAIRGDQSLFLSSEEVVASWQIVENVIEKWRENGSDLVLYERGAQPDDLKSHTIT